MPEPINRSRKDLGRWGFANQLDSVSCSRNDGNLAVFAIEERRGVSELVADGGDEAYEVGVVRCRFRMVVLWEQVFNDACCVGRLCLIVSDFEHLLQLSYGRRDIVLVPGSRVPKRIAIVVLEALREAHYNCVEKVVSGVACQAFARRPDEDDVHYSANESASRRQRIIEGVAVNPLVQRLGVLESDFL